MKDTKTTVEKLLNTIEAYKIIIEDYNQFLKRSWDREDYWKMMYEEEKSKKNKEYKIIIEDYKKLLKRSSDREDYWKMIYEEEKSKKNKE